MTALLEQAFVLAVGLLSLVFAGVAAAYGDRDADEDWTPLVLLLAGTLMILNSNSYLGLFLAVLFGGAFLASIIAAFLKSREGSKTAG